MSQLGLGMTSETSQPARRPANRRGGIAVAVAMLAILVVLAVVLVSVVRWATAKPDYSGTGHGQVTLQVKAGDSVTDVAELLARDDIDPGSDAKRVLVAMVHRFAQAESDTGLLERASAVHLTPYQVLVVASIVQAEGQTPDFPKIARAVLNRGSTGGGYCVACASSA